MHRTYTEKTEDDEVRVMRKLLKGLEHTIRIGNSSFGVYSLKELQIAVVEEDHPDVYTNYIAIGRPEDLEAFNRLYEAERKRIIAEAKKNSIEEKAA